MKCPYCDSDLDASKAAVAVSVSGDPSYVPFMEDWRGGLVEMAHPACFVEARGLNTFLEVLARHDEWVRAGFAECRDKLLELEAELASRAR
jgi:hypothetical protein